MGAMHRAMTGFRRDDDGDWVAELSCLHNQHIRHEPPFWEAAWVEDDEGSHRPQMAVYVKARGVLGGLYMKLIGPFRHWIVYPALMRQIRRAWEDRVVGVVGFEPTTLTSQRSGSGR